MKRRLKLATLLASSFALCSPTIAMMASCSKTMTYDDIARSLKDTVIEEFKWICPHYRNTFENRWFCDMLARHIEKMNPEYKVTKGMQYKPIEEHLQSAYGYNMYFDIPENDDTLEPIILQAHTDMVCSSVEGYDWTKGVVPEIEGNLMHSKDHLTSLGADDGIGVATMLAIAKQPNLFKHGRIRCLFTVDEEDGNSGMKDVPAQWFQGFTYLLNLDSENVDISWTSGGGCQQAKFEYIPKDKPGILTGTAVDIDVENFAGGHSALKLIYDIVNPVAFMGQVINAIIGKKINVRLVSCYENEKPTDKTTGGTVPNQIHFTLDTSDESAEAVKNIDDIVQALVAETIKAHPNDSKITASVKTHSESVNNLGLSTTDTESVAKLCVDRRVFGISKWLDPETKKYVKTCCNIGGARLGKKVRHSGDANTFYFETFGRSTDPVDLFDQKTGFMAVFNDASTEAGFKEQSAVTWDDIGKNNPWPYSPDNKMTKKIQEAAAAFELKMVTEPVVGWLELGEAATKKQDMQMGSLGPTIKKVHEQEETLYLDTLEPMFKLVVHIIEHITKGA